MRPRQSRNLPEPLLQRILSVCPGVRVEGMPGSLVGPHTTTDPVWGPYRRIARGWSGDPEVRFQASSGGVLSALVIHLLETRRVAFVLHVAPSRVRPARTSPRLSFNREDVLNGAQSRYQAAAPLTNFIKVLERRQPFAFIGKPCDVAAIRNLARYDARVGRYCRYLLSMFCAGVPELGETIAMLAKLGLDEDEDVAELRYRGHGNPGRIHVETHDGRVFERSFESFWSDPHGPRLQVRCKICPDAVGLSADVVAGDLWPGGKSPGEAEGCNCIVVRTAIGQELVQAACETGALVLDREVTPQELSACQPHHRRRRLAAWARLTALADANRPVPKVRGLELDTLARRHGLAANLREARETLRRALQGRTSEPPARSAAEL